MATYGSYTIDGLTSDWSSLDRIDRVGGTSGYALYGTYEQSTSTFLFSLQLTGLQISNFTLFGLNTDRNFSTGNLTFGGADYFVSFSSGLATLMMSDGSTPVPGVTLDAVLSGDGSTLEFAVSQAQLGITADIIDMVASVNATDGLTTTNVALPGNYATTSYVVDGPQAPVNVGTAIIDGQSTDWTVSDRLYTDGTNEVYGKYTGGNYVVAIKAAGGVDNATTLWINSDRDSSTGYKIFGTSGGVEYKVEIQPDLQALLYSVNPAGVETLVSSSLTYRYSADGTFFELALPGSSIGTPATGIKVLADVNNTTFLPGDYVSGGVLIQDLGGLPAASADHRIGIVYSETTAAQFFSSTAYAQLVMAAQNQAAMAGVPYDVLTEADLTNINTLAKYDTLVFPYFANVKATDVEAISNTLSDAIEAYQIGIVTAGDFMTNDETGAALPDAYARMQSILGITRVDGVSSSTTVDLRADANVNNAMMSDYLSGELIKTYTGVGAGWYTAVNGGTTLAEQHVNVTGFPTTVQPAVITTTTGGTNVHFANPSFMADNNLLYQAIQYAEGEGSNPVVTLQMTRGSSLLASRNDMDQSQETFDVSPDNNAPGIYDVMLPILQQWKAMYNFVGSYYINVGNNPPDQTTDWAKSGPYYQQMMAMGNEIGTHTYTHPHDTNELTPAEIQFEFEASKLVIEQQLGITVLGTAVPGMPETVATAELIKQYFTYMSGGYSSAGAGYPGAIGFLQPGDVDTSKVYIAPNMKFDFTLIEFQGMSAAQASAEWAAEFASLTSHANAPVIVWPWHDYGPTNWSTTENVTGNYTTQMFTDVIAMAYNAGAEFVTLADLAERVRDFQKSILTYSVTGNVVTANVTNGDAGKFALDVEGTIQNVTNWYAYDADSIFLPSTGGTFVATLGSAQDDVTHVTALPMRSELVTVTGNGTNISLTLIGEGDISIDLVDPLGRTMTVTGATVKSLVGDKLVVTLPSNGTHTVSVTLATPVNQLVTGTGLADVITSTSTPVGQPFVGAGDDTVLGLGGSDSIASGYGNDSIDGGSGSDTMAGGFGNDTYVVGSTTDVVIENTTEGTDTVLSSVTYALSANIENMTLTGAIAINGTGNELANVLVGNSASNVLDGGAGDDTMTGGLGNDTYVVDSLGDVVNEDINGGTDTVRTSLASFTLAALPNVENLTFAGTGGFAGTGNTAANSITGGTGNDTLDGVAGAGGDTLVGGAGDDSYMVRSLSDVLSELTGAGTDTANVYLSAYTLAANVENLAFLGAGNASLVGNSLNNSVTGGTGNDTIDGGAGNDTLVGLAGDDTYVVNAATDVITEALDGGTDTVLSSASYTLGANVENLTLTGTSNLNGTGNELANVITGNSGANSLVGGAGNDTFIGGTGNDTYLIADAGDEVVEGLTGGTDTIRTALAALNLALYANVENLVFSGAGDFTGTGSSVANSITGGTGNDRLDSGGGADTLVGGIGNDVYVVRTGTESIVEGSGAGSDSIELFAGSYTMAANVENLAYLGAGTASVIGNSLNNSIVGGSGDDTLNGSTGNDTLVGGLGGDVYIVNATADVVVEDLGGGIDTVQSSATYTLSANVDNLTLTGASAINGFGNALDNLIIGNSAANSIDGGLGNDTMQGGLGNDTYVVDSLLDVVSDTGGTDTIRTALTTYALADGSGIENLTYTGTAAFAGTGNTLGNSIVGGIGNDTLDGGTGTNTLVGGSGSDTYVVRSTTDVITELNGGGTDTVQLYVSNFTMAGNVENLSVMTAGNTSVTGNTLNNVMTGGGFNDLLAGAAGADTIDGGNGNDTLVGGAGSDVLTGGADADYFRFDAVSDGGDTLIDFSQAGGDKIAISAAAFGGLLLPGASLSASQFVSGASVTQATSAFGQFIYNTTSGQLWWDSDGTGILDSRHLVATLGTTTHPTLTEQGFILL